MADKSRLFAPYHRFCGLILYNMYIPYSGYFSGGGGGGGVKFSWMLGFVVKNLWSGQVGWN